MTISAVIPLYNKEKYIARAIESILNQEIKVDEIIVVDDGSIDGSDLEVEKYLGENIILIKQKNMGSAVARNRGVDEARGEYIAFLDADDEWKPEYISRIKNLINSFPNCGAYITSEEHHRPDGLVIYPELHGVPPEPWKGILPNLFELLQYSWAFNTSSVVVPKNILNEVGGFPTGVVISQDVVCWINIAIRYSIAFDPSRAVIYHQDARGRVNQQNMQLDEMPYNTIIRDAINNGEMPEHLVEAANQFMFEKQLFVAIDNIKVGNRKYGIELLQYCGKIKRFRRKWLWWRILAIFPRGWPSKAIKLRDSVFCNDKFYEATK